MKERVVTVGLRRSNQSLREFNSLKDELHQLVETAGGMVVSHFLQTRPHPLPGTLIGGGKLAEIAEFIKKSKIKTVIFDDDLTAAQQKNIEKILSAKIIDRTRLILDIFSQRARTKEGQLQVELAQLNYLVPRLTGAWRGFSQQTGGIGTRGPGERKIEVERRYVRERIKKLKQNIEHMRRHRIHIRASRSMVPLPQVALVGYTNVGKSTLLNALIGSKTDVYADDKLFATLDPTTRRVKLPGGRIVLFTDTVGFIQKLPTSLVAAFRATLEEITDASLIIHVVDAASPNNGDQQKTVLKIIEDLKAAKIPILTVYNKSDQLTDYQNKKRISYGDLALSARNGTGIKEFLAAVESRLDEQLIEVSFRLPYTKRNLLSQIYRAGYILDEKSLAKETQLKIKIDPQNWNRLHHFLNNGDPN